MAKKKGKNQLIGRKMKAQAGDAESDDMRRCVICGEMLMEQKGEVCKSCLEGKDDRNEQGDEEPVQRVCVICGEALSDQEKGELCGSCKGKKGGLMGKIAKVKTKPGKEGGNCIVCGKELSKGESQTCSACRAAVKEGTAASSVELEIEKIKGKLEILENIRPEFVDRVEKLSEEIGDIRRMILDREAEGRQMSVEFEKIKSIVEETDPSKISKDFEKVQLGIEGMESRVERSEELLKNMQKEATRNRDVLEKIKSFENLIEAAKEVQEKINKSKEDRRYMERLAGKVENIFSDMSNRELALKHSVNTIAKVDDITKDLVKEIDRIMLRLDGMIAKKDLEEFEKGVQSSIDSRFAELKKDSAAPAKTATAEGGKTSEIMKAIKALDYEKVKVRERLEELEKEIETVRDGRKSLEQLMDEKKNAVMLLGKVEEDFSRGSISRKTYHDLVEANRARIKTVDTVLDRVAKEAVHSEIRSLQKDVQKLFAKNEQNASADSMQRLKDIVAECDGRSRRAERGLMNAQLLADKEGVFKERISMLEESVIDIKESMKAIYDVEAKVNAIEGRLREAFNGSEQGAREAEKAERMYYNLREALNGLYSKLVLLEKNQPAQNRMQGDGGEISRRLAQIDERIRDIEQRKVGAQDIEELKRSVESILKRNNMVMDRIMKQMGV